MSDEYIEKEDAIQSIIAHDLVGGNAIGWAEYLLEYTSTADVAPVRHGWWISDAIGFKCTACGLHDESMCIYCPNCGARMGGVEDDEIRME